MKKYYISANLIRVIKHLHDQATSAVLFNGTIEDWLRTTTKDRQRCQLSPTLFKFNELLERIMTDALEEHEGTTITNLCFADDINGFSGGRRTGKISLVG